MTLLHSFPSKQVPALLVATIVLALCLLSQEQGVGQSAPPGPVIDVVLEWDANTEENLAGYRLYHGTAPDEFDQVIDIPLVTRFTHRVPAGATHFWRLTAVDSIGLESPPSATVSLAPIRAPAGFRISAARLIMEITPAETP